MPWFKPAKLPAPVPAKMFVEVNDDPDNILVAYGFTGQTRVLMASTMDAFIILAAKRGGIC